MSRLVENQLHLSEGNGRNATCRVLEAMGQAYKTEGRVIEYVVQKGPNASIRFITQMVILDVKKYMDSTVTVTETYRGAEEETIESRIILDRAHINHRALRRFLKRHLPLPKKVS